MPTDIRLTYEDYCALPADGKRYEIIDGELFVSPSPVTNHQKVVSNLHYFLTDHVKKNRLGEVFMAPLDVVFSNYDVVEPDLLYISKARTHVLNEKNVRGAPDLVVEVLSQNTAQIDRTTKLKLYARSGVEEYWIVDPDLCAVEICRLPESLEPVSLLQREDSLVSAMFPGFNLPLYKLLE